MRSEVQLLLDPPHPCRGCGERTAEDVQGHPSLSGRGIGTCGCPVTRLRQLTSLREQNTRRLEVVPEWGRDRVGDLRVRGSQDSLSKSEDTDREGGSGAHAPFLPRPAGSSCRGCGTGHVRLPTEGQRTGWGTSPRSSSAKRGSAGRSPRAKGPVFFWIGSSAIRAFGGCLGSKRR